MNPYSDFFIFTRLKLLLFMLALSHSLWAQNQTWYFGDKAGIDFNTSPPSALTNGQMVAQEGCSSISDKNGNLLFYTDGIRVWNRNHAQMPNGFGLKGDLSATMSALIVPDPGDTSKYFVFTLDELAGSDGMRYSIIDMALQGGTGDVSTKNIALHFNMTEKMVAFRRCDGNIWIVSHEWGSKNFFADLLTPSGFNTTVTSSVGTTHSGGGMGVINSVGQMAISQQGDRLAFAMRDADIFEVLDFDLLTGIVSNPISITSSNYYRSYGVEFSPDGTKLYGACLNTGDVYQFDLSSGIANTIRSSAIKVGGVSTLACNLKAGPDGKIYLARAIGQTNGLNYLAVINAPNQPGNACNFQDNAFSLGTKKSLLGLPNTYIDQSGNQQLAISGDTSICQGDTATLTVTGSANVQWVQGSSASSAAITVAPAATTTYSAVIPNSICGDTVSITVVVSPNAQLAIAASDTVMCPGDSITLTASGSGSSGNVQWGGGGISSTQQSIKVSPAASTSYYLTTNSGKCGGADTVHITVLASGLTASFTSEASPCGLQVDITGTTIGASIFQWDMGDGGTASGKNVSYTYAAPGNYRIGLRVINSDCNVSDTVSQIITVLDSVEKPKIITKDTRCNDGTLDFAINNDESRYQYTWTFGNGSESNSGNPTIKYSKEGGYLVRLMVVDTLCNTSFLDSTTVYLDKIVSETYIPNVFTPNGDRLNEEFALSGASCGEGDVMEIYNRWGALIFRTENPYEEFWDGKFKGQQCAEGVYFYLLFEGDEVKRGFLTLVR